MHRGRLQRQRRRQMRVLVLVLVRVRALLRARMLVRVQVRVQVRVLVLRRLRTRRLRLFRGGEVCMVLTMSTKTTMTRACVVVRSSLAPADPSLTQEMPLSVRGV